MPPEACKVCNAPSEPGYTAPLCGTCRERFVRFPVPAWLKVAMVLIALTLGYALTRFPATLKMAMVYEHGQRDENRGDNAAAEREYRQVSDAYPDAEDVKIRLAVASHRAGDDATAATVLDGFAGRKLPKSQYAELSALADDMRRNPRHVPTLEASPTP